MGYKIVKKDLINDIKKCNFCHKSLTAFKAYVLEDLASGKIIFAGRKCAQDNISEGDSLEDCPDFTNFTTSTQTHDGGGGHGNFGKEDAVDNLTRQAIEYLMLREEILPKDLNCSYQILTALYQKYKGGKLSAEDVKHINNIQAKAPKDLKLSHLKKIYNYLFWIDVAISKTPEEKAKFLIDMRQYIIKNKKITEAQKRGINRWLKRIAGVPQLK